MARITIPQPDKVDDPLIQEIFAWVTHMEGDVPNHFYVELHFPELLKAKLSTTRVLWTMGELSMQEVQHVGIAVSKANGCPYCTAAFCTILNYGLETQEDYVTHFLTEGSAMLTDTRLKTIVDFALVVNAAAQDVTDDDIARLRTVGLTDKGIVQLIHLVSDFAAYNRLNLALQTDYDYRDMWRQIAFAWQHKPGEPAGDNTRGVR